MSSPVFTLESAASIGEASSALINRHFSGAPVVDESGAAVGVISLFDIVTHLAGQERPLEAPDESAFYDAPVPHNGDEEWEMDVGRREADLMRETTVEEIMTREVIGVAPSAPVSEVAHLMIERHIHRVLVMNGTRVVGVISTMDLLGDLAGRMAPVA